MRARSDDGSVARDNYVPVDGAQLWFRDIGHGAPIVVLHGGPDFDCGYLLPELDELAGLFRLIYYDQRGRGRSTGHVRPEDVGIASETEDLDQVRRYFGLERVALLGHSWGGLLALEYALRYPGRVSHLILLNTAPVSHDDLLIVQSTRQRNEPENLTRLREIRATEAFQAGEPDAVAAYYRVHFSATIRQPARLEAIARRVTDGATPESILRSRAIEARLLEDTWLSGGYDLLPALSRLDVPTLVIHGDRDFIPIECAARIADAIPGARFVLLDDCGHFAYLERPDAVRHEIEMWVRGQGTGDRG